MGPRSAVRAQSAESKHSSPPGGVRRPAPRVNWTGLGEALLDRFQNGENNEGLDRSAAAIGRRSRLISGRRKMNCRIAREIDFAPHLLAYLSPRANSTVPFV